MTTTAAPEASSGRVITIPNLLSALRLATAPSVAWLALKRNRPAQAALVLGLVGSTDWVDGYLARRLGQVSSLGKVLDPAVDRVVITTAVAAALASGRLPRLLAAAILAREAFVSGGGIFLARSRHKRLDVVRHGKVGTFLLMAALPLFLVAEPGVARHRWMRRLACALATGGAASGWLAALDYMREAKDALAETERTE